MRSNIYSYKTSAGKQLYYYKISLKGTQYIKRGFISEDEAHKALAAFILENESRKDELLVTLFYDLCDMYKDYLKQTLKVTYYHQRCNTIDKYFKGFFKNKKIRDMTQADFTSFRNKLEKTALQDKNEILNFLKRMFMWVEDYFEYRLIYPFRLNNFRNDVPTYDFEDDGDGYVSHDIFVQYYNSLDPFYKLLILTLYVFGLRISELRALKVSSFKDGRIYVQAEATAKSGLGKTVLLTPKSKTSIRSMLVPEEYNKMLQEHIKKYNLKKNDFIFFSSRFGKINKAYPVGEQTIRNHMDEVEKKYNLVHVHPHMFRHSSVTVLKQKGFDLDNVGKYVGHSNSKVTKDYYYHLPKEEAVKFNDTLNDLVLSIEKGK